jgi:hypothetical protein
MTQIVTMNDRPWLDRIDPRPRLAGFARSEPSWLEPRRVLYDHELIIVSAGKLSFEAAEAEMDFARGTFLIVPPGIEHMSWAASPRGVVRHWLHFDWIWQGPGDLLPIACTLPGTPDNNLLRPAPRWIPAGVISGTAPDLRQALSLHRRIMHLQNADAIEERIKAKPVLTALLMELLGHAGPVRVTETRSRGSNNLAERIRDEMHRLALLPMKTNPLMRHHLKGLNVTYEHAERTFKKAYGLTPVAYLQVLRIERAKRLMIDEPDLDIGEVAARAGYSSHAYFTRQFRRHTGESPDKWRPQP